MGPRVWATFGNILRLSSLGFYLIGGLLGYSAIQLYQARVPIDRVLVPVGFGALCFVAAILLWNAKGPLVSGNFIVRLIVGLYMLTYVVTSLGTALIFIGIVYLFTGEPASYDLVRKGKEPKPAFKPPRNWEATGHIGPSGATLYTDATSGQPAGILDSWIPVQVTDKRNGLARVTAATGEGGWIDLRTLTEGV
jgi:hypothetical protein